MRRLKEHRPGLVLGGKEPAILQALSHGIQMIGHVSLGPRHIKNDDGGLVLRISKLHIIQSARQLDAVHGQTQMGA